MKAFKAIWLGDEDPAAQIIHMGDLRFIKGESITVPADHKLGELISQNPMFAVDDAKAEATPAIEPNIDPDAGTERGVVMAELDAANIKYDGRAKIDTLRELLAKG
jgi:hypothetical protein